MMSGRGISSGRSLQFDTSDSFLCCSRRIFCLFCLSAVRSSAKNADEHLDGTTKRTAVTTFLLKSLFDENSIIRNTERKQFHILWDDKNEEKRDEWRMCVEAQSLKTYRRGFPISLRIVPHSTLVNFLVFRLGKDSLRHRQNSLSPSKRGLKKKIK